MKSIATMAIVRQVSESFPRAVSCLGTAGLIDVPRARAQHEQYVSALSAAGLVTHVLPVDDRYPDGVFVEDVAVALGGVVLLTRPGAPSRRGETDCLAAFMSGRCDLERITPPATLDGGDVLQVAGRLFVGLSRRTNVEGLRQLRDVVAATGNEVVAVTVRDVLHLKSAASALDDHTVLITPRFVDAGIFSELRVLEVPDDEAVAANVLRLPNSNAILTPAGCPDTARLLQRAAFEPVVVDISEFQKADGGVTCLSLLVNC